MDENKILKCQKYYIFKIRDIVSGYCCTYTVIVY